MTQQQFLDVASRETAQRRFHDAISLAPLEAETVPLEAALGRVLAETVTSPVDVPSFDRVNYDGYAVRATDTSGASEEVPVRLRLLGERLATARVPQTPVDAGSAMSIATGGMLPRGADAVVMVEYTDEEGSDESGKILVVRKAVPPGFGVAFAGSDMTAGETVLRAGQLLTSRDTGVLAAVGISTVRVQRRPRVAIVSTGDELIAPGEPMTPAMVYDSNSRIIADAVLECGGEPVPCGIVHDDVDRLRHILRESLATADVVVLSGGTSKGDGDLSYRVVHELTDPGVVVHGVALKPGKPICLAATAGKPVVVLPGFPTSAIFTFHEFVAPVIRRLAGRHDEGRSRRPAQMAVDINSALGRTEYLMVGLVEGSSNSGTEPSDAALIAYPMPGGSGSVTTFSRADGFVTIDRHREMLPAGETVEVQLLGGELRLADLVVTGSHCVGLDYLLDELGRRGTTSKVMSIGSLGGLAAAGRGECDIAGVHLWDEATGQYNRPLLTPDLELIPGYRRLQGIVFRKDDDRFIDRAKGDIRESVCRDNRCVMVNRNRGSGTRVLIDQLLGGVQPDGYANQPRSHNAVAAAVAQGRADWGVAIENVAQRYGLGFVPLQHEEYDFIVPRSRLERPAVRAFRELLAEEPVRQGLRAMGFEPS